MFLSMANGKTLLFMLVVLASGFALGLGYGLEIGRDKNIHYTFKNQKKTQTDFIFPRFHLNAYVDGMRSIMGEVKLQQLIHDAGKKENIEKTLEIVEAMVDCRNPAEEFENVGPADEYEEVIKLACPPVYEYREEL